MTKPRKKIEELEGKIKNKEKEAMVREIPCYSTGLLDPMTTDDYCLKPFVEEFKKIPPEELFMNSQHYKELRPTKPKKKIGIGAEGLMHKDFEIKMKIKPLSVNDCWQGQRFKTPKYKAYEQELLYTLPKLTLPKPPYSIYFEFGMSNSLSDWDNPIKPLQDILQKKYGFNDKDINFATVKKVKVKKGEEYFKVKLLSYEI